VRRAPKIAGFAREQDDAQRRDDAFAPIALAIPLDVHADVVIHARQLARRLVDNHRRHPGEVLQLKDESDRENVRHDSPPRSILQGSAPRWRLLQT